MAVRGSWTLRPSSRDRLSGATYSQLGRFPASDGSTCRMLWHVPGAARG
jgi:hypothetical protein